MSAHWDAKYRAHTIPWDRGDASPALHAWLADGTLKPGRVPDRILLPGCGRGHEAVALARLGFQVTALDVAATALAHLATELDAANLHAERVCADALTWWPAVPFDAIYEQTCLCALDPGLWGDYEQRLFAWLKPGGLLLALFMQTGREGGPPFHCALDDMRALFPTTRWQWPDTPPGEVPHPNGLYELALVLTRRSDAQADAGPALPTSP